MKMLNRKILKSIVTTKFKLFCKHSTLHGFYYFYKATNWFVHLIWMFIIILNLVLCCFLGHMIWEKYVIDPTLTVVETTHYSVIKIEFPAVTVCDSEMVSLPQTQEITELLSLRGFNNTEIIDFYKSFNAVKRKGYEPAIYVKKIHAILEDVGYSLNVLLEKFKRPCSEIITECNWRSRPYNCSLMFRPVITIAGHCCQFDIPYFREHMDMQTNFVGGLESSEALDIIVMRPKETVDPNETNGNPVLYVNDRQDKVTLIDSSYSLTPESYFDVNVYTWVIDSSDNVKQLSLGVRKCILETDQRAGADFYQGCMTQLILKRVANYCRCLPFNFTAEELDVDEYAACMWERLSCVYHAIEMVQVDIKDVISDSECYQRCDYVQYDAEIEFIKHQRHVDKLNPRASRVLIHFGEMTCIKYRREILYTWDQMLANLGGIFGLCLGGSIISVIEIVWFILELFCALITSCCRKPVASKETKRDKVFTMYQKDSTTTLFPVKTNIYGTHKYFD